MQTVADNQYKLNKEHILVCLSGSPSNIKVVRAACAMTKVFDADFTALFIETSQSKNMTKLDKKRLEDNIEFAKENNAKIVTINGDDIAFLVSQYAQKSNVTKILIGRSGYKSTNFFTPPNIVDKIITLTPDIEIYIIPDKVQKTYIGQRQAKNNLFKILSLREVIKSAFIILFATLIAKTLSLYDINDANIILIYIMAVLLTAYTTGSRIYSTITSILTVFVFNFFFVRPYYSLTAYISDYYITFLIMFLVAFWGSSIAQKVKEQARLSSLKAYRTEIMLEMSQKLQQSQSVEDITKVTISQIQKLISDNVELFNVKPDGNINISSDYPNAEHINSLCQKPEDIFEIDGKTYLPIRNLNNVFAIVVLSKTNISEFEKNLLIAMLREVALAYEKEEIAKAKNKLLMKNKQEELRSTLLRGISHDLRTPLTSISGFAEILINNTNLLSEGKKQEIYTNIYDDSIWLLNLVENLLSITRFDKNEIKIKKAEEYFSDIFADVISHLGRKKGKFNIIIDLKDEMLSAPMDGRLIAQVIFNLVDNAMKYSPISTNITIGAKAAGKYVKVYVTDEGQGIPDAEKDKICEMFYTIKNASIDERRGLGLGLALCKSIITAHGGILEIKDNIPKGTIFTFTIKGDDDNNE